MIKSYCILKNRQSTYIHTYFRFEEPTTRSVSEALSAGVLFGQFANVLICQCADDCNGDSLQLLIKS
jgi:hypothetical protein